MPKPIGVALLTLLTLAGAGHDVPVDALPRRVVVRQIPVDTLRDAAVAVWDPVSPVIYYNPAVLQRLGPGLTAFLMAHEHGHLAFRHTRASALGSLRPASRSALQDRELEADCFAAESLQVENRPAVDAAVRFFSQMGPFRFDAEHPSGAQRAAKILSCLDASPTLGGTATGP